MNTSTRELKQENDVVNLHFLLTQKRRKSWETRVMPGREYEPKGQPRKTDTHDFPDKTKGKSVRYGVYDIHRDEAVVSVGISHDTAPFAVAAIRLWWKKLGKKQYGLASEYSSQPIAVAAIVLAVGFGNWNFNVWQIKQK